MEKRIGKIRSAEFGFGGYQECMLGLSVDLESTKGSWGVGDFKGFWGPQIKVSPGTKWTEETRSQHYAETMRFVGDLLKTAKVESVSDLKGIPVEVTFDRNALKSWRILEEAL